MKIILKAKVKRVTGKTRHAIGTLLDGRPIPVAPLPAPAWVGIASGQEGFFLLHLDLHGTCFNETWHDTLEAAKKQAQFEFEIPHDGWQSAHDLVDF
jgi:hypothetical protein